MVDVPVTWFETQIGLVALDDMPHGFFKLGSVNLASPGTSETKLVCWKYPPPARAVPGTLKSRLAHTQAMRRRRAIMMLNLLSEEPLQIVRTPGSPRCSPMNA